jgi:hypothetical protein
MIQIQKIKTQYYAKKKKHLQQRNGAKKQL